MSLLLAHTGHCRPDRGWAVPNASACPAHMDISQAEALGIDAEGMMAVAQAKCDDLKRLLSVLVNLSTTEFHDRQVRSSSRNRKLQPRC